MPPFGLVGTSTISGEGPPLSLYFLSLILNRVLAEVRQHA